MFFFCAASVAYLFPHGRGRAALASQRESHVSLNRSSWNLRKRDVIWLVFLVVFVAAYVYLHLWKEDFAYHDNELLTKFSLRGRSLYPFIFPHHGRVFPLELREFNLLTHLTHSPAAFQALVIVQLVACVVLTMASIDEFTIPLRVLAMFLIMTTPSFLTSFSDLVLPERNVLFWLAAFILCRRRYSAIGTPVYLAGAFISVQFALYYKEPVWLLFAGFAGTVLVPVRECITSAGLSSSSPMGGEAVPLYSRLYMP